MTHETAGDPVSGLKWTHRTTVKLAHELRGLGIHVCPQTVARLLKAMGYSLRVNHKKLAGASLRLPRSRGQVKAFGSRHGVYININSCGRCGSRAQRGIQRTCGRP